MAFFHVLALRSRNKTKLVYNRSEAQLLTEFVIPYLQTGTIQTTWGGKVQTVSVADPEVYRTEQRYDGAVGERRRAMVAECALNDRTSVPGSLTA